MDLFSSNCSELAHGINSSNSNASSAELHCEYDASLYIKITGSILFVIVWPFVVLDMKWFPLGRPAAALVGAGSMVLFQVVSQDEVYEIQGEKGNLQTVFLLVGMMMLSYYYDREGLLRVVMLKIFGQNKPFHSILWKVCLMSALLSAFITNDAACLVITPLILTEFVKQGRDKKELLPLCLGIATSANIGSAATIFGNPQNAFIASTANVSLLQFFIAELPAAILGLLINIVLIYLFLLILTKMPKKGDAPNEESHLNTRPAGRPQLMTPETVTSISNEREELAQSYEDPQMRSDASFTILTISREREATATSYDQSGDKRRGYGGAARFNTSMRRSISVLVQQPSYEVIPKEGDDNSLIGQGKEQEDETTVKKTKWQIMRRRIFLVWLVFVTLLMIVLLAIPSTVAIFNLGCIPLAASIFTMLMDTILNRKYAYDVMVKIDWTVILMFMGLFVWLRGFQKTCFIFQAFQELAPYMNLEKIGGVLLFSVFVIVGSNLFSNVPLVILIVNRLPDLCGDTQCQGPLGGLLLAWIATIAGNFTLIGSVANLIVAEKARSSAEYRLSFFGYLIFGLPSTLVILYVGLPVVYYMSKLADKI